jgi:hypothetical protein
LMMTDSPMMIRSNGFSSTRSGMVVASFQGTARARPPTIFSKHGAQKRAAGRPPFEYWKA